MQFNVEMYPESGFIKKTKAVNIDTSFIDNIEPSNCSESEIRKLVQTSVSESLGKENINLDIHNYNHLEVIQYVHFYTMMMLTQKKNEKESV